MIQLLQAESTGSSVDPQGPVEKMETEPPASGKDSSAGQTSDTDKGKKDGSKDNTTPSTGHGPPPKR